MASGKKVALVRGDDRKENIKRALSLIKDDLEPIKDASSILIKPNLVAIRPAFSNTHVEAVEVDVIQV